MILAYLKHQRVINWKKIHFSSKILHGDLWLLLTNWYHALEEITVFRTRKELSCNVVRENLWSDGNEKSVRNENCVLEKPENQ